MALKQLTLFVVCSWFVCKTEQEFFSSVDQVSQLFNEEETLLNTFSLYIDAEEENLKKMKSLLLLLQLGSFSNPQSPEETTRDPVAAFKFLKRLRHEWVNIVKFTQQSLYQEFQTLLDYSLIPELEDINSAALGLIGLQEIYKLYPHNITKETPLSADEAYYIGLVAYEEDKFQHAFLWFMHSLERLTDFSLTTKNDLLHFLSSSAYQFGNLPVAIYFGQKLLNLDPSNEEIKVRLGLYRLLRLQRTSNPNIFTLNTQSNNSYEALCRGEVDQRTSKRQRALSCRYSTGGGNPRLMYAPVKEEELWDEPKIIRYHDVISDTEIETLKDIARPELTRSQIGLGEISDIRTSQSVFVDEVGTVARISQKIADITGLSVESAERLHIRHSKHVQNYGIGGRYSPHFDAGDEVNERTATFLIYMSDVEVGGATVFPYVGVAVKPEKGSAVFWYNLHKNGELDLKTKHAGCPVLVGNKWVANKWIHEFGQEFRRPCSLLQWE